MNRISSNPHTRAVQRCRNAWACERCGDFESGLLDFSPDWADPEFLPAVDGLPENLASETLLRFASLLGYQGNAQKISGSQVRARDILTRALGYFIQAGNEEKAAECENHIALTYSRTGERAEARTWLSAASLRDLPPNSLHRLATIAYEMLMNVGEQKYDDNIALYDAHEPAFREWADDWIAASFYINAAVGFMESDRPDDAIACLEVADLRAERSSMLLQRGFVQNELAHVYRSVGRYEKAHFYIDTGIEIFRSLSDHTREGMLLDTKASIYLLEGDLERARDAADLAIATLEGGENTSYLAEAYTTQARILVFLDQFAAGVSALFEGVQLARKYSGPEFVSSLIGQFDAAVREKNNPAVVRDRSHGLESEGLVLDLPASLAGYTHYQGIRINSDHLACVGIQRNSLVVSVKTEIERGDLVAVLEKDSGEISCGFYDFDFGVLCIEDCGSEPRLFDPNEVEIIGKIVGIARDPDSNGLRTVMPIKERLTS